MKKWLAIAGVVILVFAGGYLALSFYAVKFLQAQIQKMIGPGFTIEQVQVKATHLSIHGIRFEDPRTKKTFLGVEEMKIYPDLRSFLKKRLHIREWAILSPSFFFYRTRDGITIGPWVSIPKEEKSGEASHREVKKEKETIPIRIDRFRIEKGSIDFDDMKAGETPGQIRLRDIDLKLENIRYPSVSSQSPIELKGKIKGVAKSGEIFAKGWVDLASLDMEVLLKMGEVELKTFEPYYRKRVSAEIESGHMNMDATVTIKSQRINAPGHMELADLQIKEEGTVFYLPAKTLASLLKDKGNRVKVKFHVKGNMDDPRFDLQDAFLTQMAFSFAEVLGLPIKSVGAGESEGGAGLFEGLFKKREKKR
ncbi:MAG: DUF748 domain-containing protein [Deltaproteobacteria bacterium]|nr:DUF748 domain-containing protein [Deltaproteobacteria bacterium]